MSFYKRNSIVSKIVENEKKNQQKIEGEDEWHFSFKSTTVTAFTYVDSSKIKSTNNRLHNRKITVINLLININSLLKNQHSKIGNVFHGVLS